MAKQIYGAVRLDKLQAITGGNLASVRVSVQTDNGTIVALGALEDNNREVYNAATPTAVASQEILLIASPELTYYNDDLIVNFTNLAGKVARAYHMTVGDIVTITDVNITGTSVKEQYLIPQNGSNKLTAAASAGSSRFVARVLNKTKIYGQPATVFVVEKA